MNRSQLFWAIVINSIWVFPIIYELAVVPISDNWKLHKKNKELIVKNRNRMRLQCVNCKYCKTFEYHPFYRYGKHGNFMVQKLPKYCKRFRTSLKPELYQTCIERDNEQAMFVEESN